MRAAARGPAARAVIHPSLRIDRVGQTGSRAVCPGRAERGGQGHLAEPQGDPDHHRPRAGDVGAGRGVLPGGGPVDRAGHARRVRAGVGNGKMAEKRWYVVHVYSGFEKKIAEQIKQQAAQKGLADAFAEILVPSEEVTEVRRGQKINSERKFFPGYVLVKMEMSDDAWHLVKDTPKVTGFLGNKNKPSPITEAEAQRIVNQVKEGVDKPRKPAVVYEVGEQVRVADGPFTSFMGTIEEVDEERGRVKVSVSIFGRSTPVELEYTQVERVGRDPRPGGPRHRLARLVPIGGRPSH